MIFFLIVLWYIILGSVLDINERLRLLGINIDRFSIVFVFEVC